MMSPSLSSPESPNQVTQVSHHLTPVARYRRLSAVRSGVEGTDEARADRQVSEPRALLVVRKRLEVKPLEQDAQSAFDGGNAQTELRGDLVIRRRKRMIDSEQRPAQRNEHQALRGRHSRRASQRPGGLG